MRMFWLAMLVLAVIAAALLWREGASSARDDHAGSVALAPPADVAAVTTTSGVEPVASGAAHSVVNVDAAHKPAADAGSAATIDAQALADDLASGESEAGDDALADALDDGSVPAPPTMDDQENGGGIDGKYILAGDGSIETPYEITWDLLLLASQTYRPREGKTDIPAALDAVNGKHIKIAGYFAFPMASTDSREVLFMLNMWDGCCIGLPPSPYDAIEVRLKEPLGGKKQFVNYGTLSGTLKVDPYVQNGWLLGMYLMEDGELEMGM